MQNSLGAARSWPRCPPAHSCPQHSVRVRVQLVVSGERHLLRFWLEADQACAPTQRRSMPSEGAQTMLSLNCWAHRRPIPPGMEGRELI